MLALFKEALRLHATVSVGCDRPGHGWAVEFSDAGFGALESARDEADALARQVVEEEVARARARILDRLTAARIEASLR